MFDRMVVRLDVVAASYCTNWKWSTDWDEMVDRLGRTVDRFSEQYLLRTVFRAGLKPGLCNCLRSISWPSCG